MRTYRVGPDSEPMVEGEEPNTHFMFTVGVEVTLEQHLELLASPKACNLLGADNTNERIIYKHRREWYGWPEAPPINPGEEEF